METTVTIKISDYKLYKTFFSFINSLKQIEIISINNTEVNDLYELSEYSLKSIFENLGTDEDYKEWINAKEI